MPLSEQLLSAMSEKKYDTALNILVSNPGNNLVNTTDENGESLLMRVLSSTAKSPELIKFILNDKEFNLYYRNTETSETNIDAMITAAKADILELALFDSKILFNNEKLTYECTKAELGFKVESLKKNSAKDPESANTKRLEQKVENLQKMTIMLRDATILHAIKTDNRLIMTQLDKADAKPLEALSNGTVPRTLITKEKTPQVSMWLQEVDFTKSVAALRASNANSKPLFQSSLEKARIAETQMKAAIAAKQLKDAEILKNNLAQKEAILAQMQNLMKNGK